MNVSSCICLAGNAGADRITDAIDESSLLLGQLDGSQGIGSLATLRNSYHHIVTGHHRVAVTEFGSILYLYWHTTIVLYHLLAYQTCMP